MIAPTTRGSVDEILRRRDARLREPVAGRAKHVEMWEFASFDLDALRRDALIATEGYDWTRGMFGHSLPLTISRLSDFGARHYNNRVLGDFAEPLERCAYFREIFEAFRCPKSSFRLLRRPGHSGYTIHNDRDLGDRTVRVQIPIFTNDSVIVMASEVRELNDFICNHPSLVVTKNWQRQGVSVEQMRGWVAEFVVANRDRVLCYRLEPGRLYHFDTSKFHNVWNFGTTERITLAFDLVANDWLTDHFPELAVPERLVASGARGPGDWSGGGAGNQPRGTLGRR